MEEANEDTFALNKLISGSAQRPILFDSERGEITYGEDTVVNRERAERAEAVVMILSAIAEHNGGKLPDHLLLHHDENVVLDGLKAGEVEFLHRKHTGDIKDLPILRPSLADLPIFQTGPQFIRPTNMPWGG